MKDGSLGVQEMQDFIRQTSIQFPTDRLKVRKFFENYKFDIIQFFLQKFPDLRFKYVEEEQPEDFFVPYTWSLLKNQIYWNPDKISLRGAFLEQ